MTRVCLFALLLLSVAWVAAIDSESEVDTDQAAQLDTDVHLANSLTHDMVLLLATLHLVKPLGATCSQLVDGTGGI